MSLCVKVWRKEWSDTAGRLIPAGTGYKGSKKYEMIEKLNRDLAAQDAATAPRQSSDA